MKFNAASNLNQQFDTACTRHLRQQVATRLAAAHNKVSATAVFQNAAQPKKGHDMVSAIGSILLIGALFQGAEQAICDYLGLDGDFLPEGIVAGAVELGINVRESLTEDEGKFKNKVEGYPEGRRKDLFGMKKPSKQFNLVCHNDHGQFDEDGAHEVRTMSDLLNALVALEQKGTSELKIAAGQSVKQAVYAAMRQPTARVVTGALKPMALAA